MGRSFLVLGKAAVWLGSGYDDWKVKLTEALPALGEQDHRSVVLDFRVTEFERRGHKFDVDNLACVVFQATFGPRRSKGRRALRWWRATMSRYPFPSLLATLSSEEHPSFEVPGATPIFDEEIPRPFPSDSRDGDNGMAEFVRSKMRGRLPQEEDRFALRLRFGPDQEDITNVEEIPIKPLVDCLYPAFGGEPGYGKDWKLFLVQVERGEPSLSSRCRVTLWHLDPEVRPGTATSAKEPAARIEPAAIRPAVPRAQGRTTMAESNYDRLDEAAAALGSPPKELSLDQILGKARELYAAMASTKRDSASATMDYQCINVKGRASSPGDFNKPDRWNKKPRFIKVRPGVYRRLSDEERQAFARFWGKGEALLRRESFEPREWDSLRGK